MTFISCKCKNCWEEFEIEVPDEVNDLFIDEKETDEACGEAACPFCETTERLLNVACGDCEEDSFVKGKWRN